MFFYKKIIHIFIVVFLLISSITLKVAVSSELPVITATVTKDKIILDPNYILPNQAFIIKVINETGIPVELENLDTSVEIYEHINKTFKKGLPKGDYMFFNDFNPNTKNAILHITTEKINNTSVVNNNSNSYIKNNNDYIISFIVFRESTEALFIIILIFSWLQKIKLNSIQIYKKGITYLMLGTIVGVASCFITEVIFIKINALLPTIMRNYIQTILLFTSIIMIVCLVYWMNKYGKYIKSNLFNNLNSSLTRKIGLSIFLITFLSIIREGSEMIIFISALGFGKDGVIAYSTMKSIFYGLLVSILVILVIYKISKYLSWKYFFKIVNIMLLLIAGGITIAFTDNLIGLNIIPNILTVKIWDTSWLLHDGGDLSPLLNSIIGYKAKPSLLNIICYVIYWLIIYVTINKNNNNESTIRNN